MHQKSCVSLEFLPLMTSFLHQHGLNGLIKSQLSLSTAQHSNVLIYALLLLPHAIFRQSLRSLVQKIIKNTLHSAKKTSYQEDRRQRRCNRGLNHILSYGNISNLRWSLYLQIVWTTIMEIIVPRIAINIIAREEQCVENQMESVHRDVNQASQGINVQMVR